MPQSAIHIHIAKPFAQLRNEFNTLEMHFSNSNNILHQKRNVIKQVTFGSHNLVVKSFKQPSRIQSWIYANLRHSKARRSFEHAERLKALGINTPEAIAYIEHTHNNSLGKSYYVSLFLKHDLSMQDVMVEMMQTATDEALSIIKAFTRFTFSMHQNNVLHLDHNAGNTLICTSGDGYLFSVIDINRMQFKTLSLKQRLNNFVRLTDNPLILSTFANTYADCMNIDRRICQQLLTALNNKHNFKLRLKRRAKKLLGR